MSKLYTKTVCCIEFSEGKRENAMVRVCRKIQLRMVMNGMAKVLLCTYIFDARETAKRFHILPQERTTNAHVELFSSFITTKIANFISNFVRFPIGATSAAMCRRRRSQTKKENNTNATLCERNSPSIGNNETVECVHFQSSSVLSNK